MKNQSNIKILFHFFKSFFDNNEVSPTEVENFLQAYLTYIFDINSLNLLNYDININKVNLTETHSKRSHEFKKECNKETRNREKNKTLTKRGYHAYCDNDYYEAMMRPSQTIKNKYDILINQNICRARNEEEFDNIIYFIQIFGHEVHHIIQEIRHVQETERYDYLLLLNDANLQQSSELYNPNDARKIKRLIHQHISSMYATCKPELYADKKGFDYLDILFNDIFKYIESDKKEVNNIDLKNFLAECQVLNEEFYQERIPYNKKYKKLDKKVCKKLKKFGYSGDDLEID